MESIYEIGNFVVIESGTFFDVRNKQGKVISVLEDKLQAKVRARSLYFAEKKEEKKAQ
jgi:hypothetical protein